MVAVAPGLFYRHLTIDEVLARQRARSAREVARHNTHVVDQLQLEHVPAKRDQVLGEFDPATRRWARDR